MVGTPGTAVNGRLEGTRLGTVETWPYVLLLVLLIVLIFAGAGFAVHLLWIAAVIFALFWLVGAALGRGETAGHHKFYRW